MSGNSAKKRVLAIASGGGHWTQLLRLRPAFDGCTVHFATVDATAAAAVRPAPVHTFPDANRDTKIRLIFAILKVMWIVLRVRPHVIVSTGAAPGYLAIRFGKMLGARTMFIDSIANAQEMSLSAHLAKRHADRLLSQWPEVAEKENVVYRGSVL